MFRNCCAALYVGIILAGSITANQEIPACSNTDATVECHSICNAPYGGNGCQISGFYDPQNPPVSLPYDWDCECYVSGTSQGCRLDPLSVFGQCGAYRFYIWAAVGCIDAPPCNCMKLKDEEEVCVLYKNCRLKGSLVVCSNPATDCEPYVETITVKQQVTGSEDCCSGEP